MEKKRYAAIVLSAGRGSRMKSEIPKQYLTLDGRPVIYYALSAFEQSCVQDIILVSGEEDGQFCQNEIVKKYGFDKVKAVIAGGKERYHSVFCGLKELEQRKKQPDYVMIHDGARPFVNQEIIMRCAEMAEQYQACVAGMPVKDTIKIADLNQFAAKTPERELVWQVQTPQVFSFPLIFQAYRRLMEMEEEGGNISVTDDAMVLETILGKEVRLVEGSYKNIKITTPEDFQMAEIFLKDHAE